MVKSATRPSVGGSSGGKGKRLVDADIGWSPFGDNLAMDSCEYWALIIPAFLRTDAK